LDPSVIEKTKNWEIEKFSKILNVYQ
jgi:hypothetical protein